MCISISPVFTNDRSLFPGKKEVSQIFRDAQGKTVPGEKNARILDHLDEIGASPGRTGSIDLMLPFAAAQNKTTQERWEAVQAFKTAKKAANCY
jgi:hypothetical protein